MNSLSETVTSSLKDFIARFKDDRAFWNRAVCRILTDTDSVLVLEYCDMAYERAEIVVFTNRIRQKSITVYPYVNWTSTYCVDGTKIMTGAEIDSEGIVIQLQGNFRSASVQLQRVTE